VLGLWPGIAAGHWGHDDGQAGVMAVAAAPGHRVRARIHYRAVTCVFMDQCVVCHAAIWCSLISPPRTCFSADLVLGEVDRLWRDYPGVDQSSNW